jgi:hypothetical protein
MFVRHLSGKTSIIQILNVPPAQELSPQMLTAPAVCQGKVGWEQNMQTCVFSLQGHYPAHAASPGLQLLGKALEFVHGTPMAETMISASFLNIFRSRTMKLAELL